MKALIFAVLLVVLQAVPPIPRKATDNPASGSRGVKAETNNNQSPSAPAKSVQGPAATQQNQSTTSPKTNAEKSVPVRDFSSSRKDWWDRAYVICTGLLVIVGVVGTCLALRTLKAMQRQAELMDKTMVLTFRPKLIIRGIALIPGRLVEIAGTTDVEDDLVWQIQYVVANTGGVAAHVTASNLTITKIEMVDGALPTFPPYSGSRDSMGTFTVQPGEHKEGFIKLDRYTDTGRFRLLRAVREGGSTTPGNLYCLGFIEYRDAAAVKRRTAFCLHYDAQTERFERVGNPAFEYAD
jgi:hypothetical protein